MNRASRRGEGLCMILEGGGLVGVYRWGQFCGEIWFRNVLSCAGCGGQEKCDEFG